MDELKANTEIYLNNMIPKKGRFNIDDFQRYVGEDIYSICGKNPLISIIEMK